MELATPMLSARGEVELTLRDVVTGRVETVHSRNSLTPYGLSLLRRLRFNGSSLVTNFYLNGEFGRRKTATLIRRNTNPPFPLSVQYGAVFAPGEGTGPVDYIMTSTNPETSVFIYTLPQPITKGPNHELTVVWTCYLDIPQRVSQKLIPGGQRDGVTDVLVTTYVTDYMAQRVIYGAAVPSEPPETSLYFYRAGTSNAPSDIQNDTDNLKGSSLGEIQGTGLTIRAGTSDWNGQIGEIVVLQRTGSYTNIPDCRFTFDS